MSKGRSGFCRWTALLLVFIFTFVSSGVLMLTPQPVEAALTRAEAATNSKKISAGFDHCLAITAEGTVIAWGLNNYRQCNVPPELNNVVAVSAGWKHSMALKADGTVVAWGLARFNESTIPEGVQGNVVAIASGKHLAMVLKKDGTVVAWGENYDGQLGVNGATNVIAIAAGFDAVDKIYAGFFNTLVLKNTGAVQVWGNNTAGQRTIPAAAKSNVVAIAVAEKKCMALKEDGSIVNWGVKGTGDDLVGPAVAIAAGSSFNLKLTAEGSLIAKGPGVFDIPEEILPGEAIAIAACTTYAMVLLTDGSIIVLGAEGKEINYVPAVVNRNPGLSNLRAGYFDDLGLPVYLNLSPNFDSEKTGYSVFTPFNYTLAGPPEDRLFLFLTPEDQNSSLSAGNGLGFVSPSKAVEANSIFKLGGRDSQPVIFVKTGVNPRKYSLRFEGRRPTLRLDFDPDQLVFSQAVAKKIDCGQGHALALKANGTVVAWGDNSRGQCDVPAGLNSIVGIAAGGYHSLALKTDGTVVAWGDNSQQQCVVPAGLSEVIAIASGVCDRSYHSLALKADGTVVAWGGDNSHGQRDVPAELSEVIAIAAGAVHSLALKADGTLAGWGDGSIVYGGGRGQYCQKGVLAIAAGTSHSTLLTVGGDVASWGSDNDYGQLDEPYHLTYHGVAISAGNQMSLGLRSDGLVMSWGRDQFGLEGPPFNLNNSVAIKAGGRFYIGLKKDGTVVACGDEVAGNYDVPAGLNLAGELSNLIVNGGILSSEFNTDTLDYTVQVPESSAVAVTATLANPEHLLTINGQAQTSGIARAVDVVEGTPIKIKVNDGLLIRTYTLNIEKLSPFEIARQAGKRIAIGGLHSLALPVNSTLVAWGDESKGQCNIPVAIQGSVIEVVAGKAHSVALKSDGTVEAWGSGINGECAVPAGLSNVVAVSAGTSHSLALKADGTVVAWGDDTYGQCTVPVGLSNVVAIAAGKAHSLALKADGTVVPWGDDTYGQCTVPVGLGNVVAIAAGDYHTVALQAENTIVAWGDNNDGQCTVPVDIQGSVVVITAGGNCSQVLKADGTVVAWGENNSEQCNVPEGLNLLGGLSDLTVGSGSLFPALNKDTLSYAVSADWDAASINVIAAAEVPGKQELSVNGLKLASGVPKIIPLDSSTLLLDVQIPTEGLKRTYTVTMSPVFNLKFTDFQNITAVQSVFGAQILSKLSFDVPQNINGLTINLDFPEGLEIASTDGLYKDGVLVPIAVEKINNEISIDTALQAGSYELKFILKASTIKVPITVNSFNNQAGVIVTPFSEFFQS